MHYTYWWSGETWGYIYPTYGNSSIFWPNTRFVFDMQSLSLRKKCLTIEVYSNLSQYTVVLYTMWDASRYVLVDDFSLSAVFITYIMHANVGLCPPYTDWASRRYNLCWMDNHTAAVFSMTDLWNVWVVFSWFSCCCVLYSQNWVRRSDELCNRYWLPERMTACLLNVEWTNYLEFVEKRERIHGQIVRQKFSAHACFYVWDAYCFPFRCLCIGGVPMSLNKPACWSMVDLGRGQFM